MCVFDLALVVAADLGRTSRKTPCLVYATYAAGVIARSRFAIFYNGRYPNLDSGRFVF